MGQLDQSQDGLSGKRLPLSDDLLFRAATLYYVEDRTQLEVAQALDTSRATVSRLLAQARERGIVKISVQRPSTLGADALAQQLSDALGLKGAWVAESKPGMSVGAVLAQPVAEALVHTQLNPTDGLLVGPGQAVWDVSRRRMPTLPGVLIAPTTGGMDELEPFFQTNEITRCMADSTSGQPNYLYAPALPGAELYELLMREPVIRRVTGLWGRARVALLGVGAPLATRAWYPSVLPRTLPSLSAAVGDICMRPYDRDGMPIPFPGSSHLMAMELAALRQLEWSIGVALGSAKIESILVAVAAGYLNALVTDAATATLLIERA